jgi:hypothetical protein
MRRADAHNPWEDIFPSRCYALAGLQLHLSVRRSPQSPLPLNRHRLRRLGTQLPEGARIAPGRPLDAFAVAGWWLRRACSRTGQRWVRTGPMAGATVTHYDALPKYAGGGDEKTLQSRRQTG